MPQGTDNRDAPPKGESDSLTGQRSAEFFLEISEADASWPTGKRLQCRREDESSTLKKS